MMRMAIALATVLAVSPALAGEHVLFNFDSPDAKANGALVRDGHGTTYRGGGDVNGGTIFKVNP